MISLNEALQRLLGSVEIRNDVERLPILEADGRVLAQDVVSALHVPPHDNSAMDGYAVRCADVSAAGTALPTILPISQRIAAGTVGTPLLAGTAARIFTGAPVPVGADAVIMQEECTLLENGSVQINAVPKPNQNIRRAGEDVTRGAKVLSKGDRLTPASQGLAASLGFSHVDVVRRPRVALLSTGNELVMPGTIAPEDMPAGAIYNSNRFFLHSLLRRMGCEVSDLGIVPDQREATIQALQTAAATHDVILTSGGVSVGEEDHIKPAVQALGSLDLWQIAIKPGKPFAHGRIGENGKTHFLGLPGNPVASFVTFLILVRPFLLRLQGARDVDVDVDVDIKKIALRADFTCPRADKRQEFLRVRRNEKGGLDLFPNQSSGVLTSVVWGDGLVDKPAGTTIAAGDMVQFIAYENLY
ncbi:MAG: hypothetical protein RIR79_1960 [Pseudomonadota bacterium]|jgi:molybdopterin molybdotransferase